VLLDCSIDCRTAAFFPGHQILSEDDRWVGYPDDAPEPPASRVTLTIPVINHAKRIAFTATGQPKAGILHSVLDERTALPCSYVKPIHPGQLYWFVDDAAAESVKYSKTPFSV
jgi:6-phosphogluconolactonase